MDPLLLGLFLGITLIVIFSSSLLARLFKAKRHKIYWAVIPWLLAIVAIIAANIFQLDGLYALGIGIATFIVLFKLITGLDLLSSLTVTIASFAVMGMLFAGSIIGLGKGGFETDEFVNTALVMAPESEFYDLSFLQRNKNTGTESLFEAEEMVSFSEKDLLPSASVAKKALAARSFQELNPTKADSVRGARVRLMKHNGDLVKGSIVGLKGNKLVISKYVSNKGTIEAPIPLSSIKKMEVYR